MRPELPIRAAVLASALITTNVWSPNALGGDPAEAREALKQGYELKQAGRCSEAIAHFARSFSLAPTAKALLNLADCEQRVGHLLAAQDEAVRGRAFAVDQKDVELVQIADGLLAITQQRLPRLTIALAAGAPAGCRVWRDGLEIASELGAPMAIDPGAHAVVVAAPGYRERRYDISLEESDRVRIEVQPLEQVREGSAARTQTLPRPIPPEFGDTAEPESPTKLLAYASFGVAALGLVGGVAAGITAGRLHDSLETSCADQNCPASAADTLDNFRALRTLSTVGYVFALAGGASGALLWFASSPGHARSSGRSVRLGVGLGSTSLIGDF